MAEWRPRTVSPKKTQWASASSRRGSVSARRRSAYAGHAGRVAARRPTAANTMETNPETGEWRMVTVFRTSITPLADPIPGDSRRTNYVGVYAIGAVHATGTGGAGRRGWAGFPISSPRHGIADRSRDRMRSLG